MATRTSSAGNIVFNSAIASSDINNQPGGLVGYAKVTADVTSITTAVDLTGYTLTLTPPASRILRIDYRLSLGSTVANDGFGVIVMKDGSQVDRTNWGLSLAKAGAAVGFWYDIGPTNASHVYKLQGGRNAVSTGTFTVDASATTPGWLTITDMGPSF